jgi:hypothetical protein
LHFPLRQRHEKVFQILATLRELDGPQPAADESSAVPELGSALRLTDSEADETQDLVLDQGTIANTKIHYAASANRST